MLVMLIDDQDIPLSKRLKHPKIKNKIGSTFIVASSVVHTTGQIAYSLVGYEQFGFSFANRYIVLSDVPVLFPEEIIQTLK